MCHSGQPEIELQILAYLDEHPQAQDSLRGVAEWWLLERKIKYQIELVKAALAALVEKNLIIEHRESSAGLESNLYELNKDKREEIKKLLEP